MHYAALISAVALSFTVSSVSATPIPQDHAELLSPAEFLNPKPSVTVHSRPTFNPDLIIARESVHGKRDPFVIVPSFPVHTAIAATPSQLAQIHSLPGDSIFSRGPVSETLSGDLVDTLPVSKCEGPHCPVIAREPQLEPQLSSDLPFENPNVGPGGLPVDHCLGPHCPVFARAPQVPIDFFGPPSDSPGGLPVDHCLGPHCPVWAREPQEASYADIQASREALVNARPQGPAFDGEAVTKREVDELVQRMVEVVKRSIE